MEIDYEEYVTCTGACGCHCRSEDCRNCPADCNQDFDCSWVCSPKERELCGWEYHSMDETDRSWECRIDELDSEYVTTWCAEHYNECSAHTDCDDGIWCNGPETCRNSICFSGAPPCADDSSPCNERDDRCGTFVLLSTIEADGDLPARVVTVAEDSGFQAVLSPLNGCGRQASLDGEPASGLLYGIDPFGEAGQLVRIDPESGTCDIAATLEAEGRPLKIHALAFATNGTLYGITQPDWRNPTPTLGVIDLAAHAFVPVVSVAVEEHTLISSMDFSPDDVLYAVTIGAGWPALVTIDIATGELAVIGQLVSLVVDDIDYAPNGFVYFTNFGSLLGRMDPADPVQESLGHGGLGALGGVASRVD